MRTRFPGEMVIVLRIFQIDRRILRWNWLVILAYLQRIGSPV